MTDERGVRENQRIQGSFRADGDIASGFLLGNHNIITVKTVQHLLFRRFYRQGIQIKGIGVDYTGSILFTGLGDSNLSVGGHFQYVFPNTKGGVLNDMITAEVHNFTFEEQQLMSIYNPGTRLGLIHALVEMRTYLDMDEQELKDLTDSAIAKLNLLTDAEFATLDLIPDFDEEE